MISVASSVLLGSVGSSVLLGLVALVVLYALLVAVIFLLGRRTQAGALARFLPDCAVLFARLVRDPRVARRHKLLLLALLAYFAMPFDLILDAIPVIGQLDDAILAALLLRHLIRAGGANLLAELWPGPRESLDLLLLFACGHTTPARDPHATQTRDQ